MNNRNAAFLTASSIIKRTYQVLSSEGFQLQSEPTAVIPYLMLWLRNDSPLELLHASMPLRFPMLAAGSGSEELPHSHDLAHSLELLEDMRLRLSSRTLSRVSELLATLKLPTLPQAAYAALLDYALDYPAQAASGPNRSYLVPIELLEFITQVYPVHEGDSLYNPYAGTCQLASFLPATVQYYGQEPLWLEQALGTLRLAAHGLLHAFVTPQDPLRQWPSHRRWDMILVPRPMFRTDRIEGLSGSFATQSFDIALVQQIMQSLAPAGRAIIAVPASFLWHSIREHRLLRENLVTSGVLEAVIEFPAGLLHNTTASFALLLLNRNQRPQSQVLLLDAEEYTKRQGRQAVLDVPGLLKAFRQPSSAAALYVAPEELADQYFELSARRYLTPQEPVGKQARLLQVVSQLPTRSERVLPPEGRLIRIRDLRSDNFEFTLTTDLVPVEELGQRQLVPLTQTALLVALQGGALKPTWYVHQPEQVVYLPPYIKPLHIHSDAVDLAYLISELNSEFVRKQVKAFNTGAVMPSIRKDDLLRLILRLPPPDEQQEIVAHAREQVLQIKEKEKDAVQATQQVKEEAYAQFASLKHALGTPLQELASGLRRLERVIERYNMAGQLLALDSLMHPADAVTTVRHTIEAMKQARDYIYETVHRDEAELNVRSYALKSIDLLDFLNRLVKRKQATDQCFTLALLDLASVAGNEETFFGLIKFYVQANEALLNRLFDNILDNSARHGFANTRTEQNRVRIWVHSSFGDKLIIAIHNNGAPLPDGWEVDRLFIRGAKAGSTGRSGIGGYEVKEIVDYFNGSITVKPSNLNGYTVAYVITLPVAASELQTPDPISSDDVPSSLD